MNRAIKKKASRRGVRLHWLYLHYPRVPEGRDGLLLRIYDRWSVKLTPSGRGAIGALFLLSIVEMLPGLSPIFLILLLVLSLLFFELLRSAPSGKATLLTPKIWRAYPGEERPLAVSWTSSFRGAAVAPRVTRLPDGVKLLISPHYSSCSDGAGEFVFAGVRRGLWRLDYLRLAERNGLQLSDRWSARAPAVTMLVRPRPLPVSSMQLLQRKMSAPLYEELTGAPRIGNFGEFRSLRPYIQGDPLRSIHPRSSARWGKPVVRVDEEPVISGESVAILIDCRVGSLAERLAFEALISLAAGWAVALVLKEIPVSLFLLKTGERIEPCAPTSTLDVEALLDSLAPVQPERIGRRERKKGKTSGAIDTASIAARGWLLSTSSRRCGRMSRGWGGIELYHREKNGVSEQGWEQFDTEPWGVSDR